MNTKARENEKGPKRFVAEPAPNFLSEWNRHQLALMVDATTALCRGSEALRQIQQQAAHDVSVFHEETAQKLFSPCQPADLLAIQSGIVQFTLQSAGKYWQQLAARTVQTQVDLMNTVGHVLESEKQTGCRSPMEILQSAIPPLANSFFPMTVHLPDGQALHS